MGSLQQDLKAGRLKPIYIVYGTEELLKREAISAICEAALKDTPRDFNETRLLWRETNADAVVGACRTFPMMGPRRLVYVSGADDIKGEAGKTLGAYAEDPSETTVLLLAGTRFEARTKLFKAAKKIGHIEKCVAPYQNRIPQWISERARARGLRIDTDAARLLADVVGNRLAALDEALERLFLYVAEGDAEVHVRLEHVEQCIARTRVHSVFDLTDALGRRDAAAATRVLEAMAANREPPIKTLGAIAFHFRRLWKLLDGMQSGGTADEVGRALNINGYFLRDFVRQSRMFTHRELAWLLNRLYETDKLLKSSRAAPEHHMQSLVLDICVR